VVGAGGIAQVVHLPILKRLPDVEVVALVDTHLEKARTIADRFQVPVVSRTLAELPDAVDAVLVSTPTDSHAELVTEALEQGCHVLCERPLAPSSDEVAKLIEAAEAADRQLMVAMNQRYRLDVRAIQQFVASGELGEVFLVRSVWLTRSERRPRRGWRRDPEHSGGGVLMDLGVQALDAALWLLGYPDVQRVSAREGGSALQLEVSWELRAERDRHAIRLLGTLGSAGVSPFRVRKEMETGLTDVTPPLDVDESGLYTAAYRREWTEFLRFVRGDKPLDYPSEQIRLMRVVEACYRSAQEGCEVTV
jgi:predicted dehydrogenase